MDKTVIRLTDEELTNLMNKTYLQVGEYKITYSAYKPQVCEKYVITLTSDDLDTITEGSKVEYDGFIFEHAGEDLRDELTKCRDRLENSVEFLRYKHKEGKTLSFSELIDAIGTLYNAVYEIYGGYELWDSDASYILSVATRNIPYLKKKLVASVSKETLTDASIGTTMSSLYNKALDQLEVLKMDYDRVGYLIECKPEPTEDEINPGTMLVKVDNFALEHLGDGDAIRVSQNKKSFLIYSKDCKITKNFRSIDEMLTTMETIDTNWTSSRVFEKEN